VKCAAFSPDDAVHRGNNLDAKQAQNAKRKPVAGAADDDDGIGAESDGGANQADRGPDLAYVIKQCGRLMLERNGAVFDDEIAIAQAAWVGVAGDDAGLCVELFDDVVELSGVGHGDLGGVFLACFPMAVGSQDIAWAGRVEDS